MSTDKTLGITHFSTVLMAIIIAVGLIAAGLAGYSISALSSSAKIDSLQSEIASLQEQISNVNSTVSILNQSSTYILGENVSLSELHEQVKILSSSFVG